MNHSGASQPGTSSSLIPSKYRFAQVRVNGVKRKLVFTDSSEKPRKEEVDPKTIELMSRFFVSQGLSMKCVREPTFINLVRYLNPSRSIPSQFQMKSFLANSSKKIKEKPIAHFTRGVGPLCLTLDYVGDDQKYLVYSIHWFEKVFERQNIVCFWRLRLRDIRDSDSLLLPARTSVDSVSYATVKFDSIVLPSLEAYDLVVRSRVGKRYYVCFHHYMTMFVEKLMRIPELAKGLDQLNNLICFIREHSQFYTLFENIKKARNVQFDLPITQRGERWEQTFMFLTKCLALHDTFFEYAEEAGYQNYISNTMFNYLLYFQRLFQQCVNISRELSQPHNSISQVIPKINELKTFILGSKRGYRFQTTVEESFKYVFENITHDKSHFLYETASLLDPRYAYGKTFSLEKWLNIERRASEEFQITSEDSDLITVHQRQKIIKDNFEMYRQMLELGVEQSENPFQWWTECHKAMKFLSEVALQYLACPATTVNASTYFGKGGKFEHLCDSLSFKDLDTFLINAGMHQKYVGKGFNNNEEEITPELKESLENTANRLHVRRVFIPRDPTLRVSQFLYNLKVPVALFPVKVVSNPPSVLKNPLPPPPPADEALEEVNFLENEVKVEDDDLLRAPPINVPLEDKPTDFALLSEVKYEDLEIAEDGERLGKMYEEALEFAELQGRAPRTGNPYRPLCCICGGAGEQDERFFKSVTMDTELVLLLLACLFRGETTMSKALAYLSETKKHYVCSTDFEITIYTLYEKLELRCPDDIRTCSADRLQDTFKSMQCLRPHTTFQQFIKILHDFFEKYDHLRAPVKQDLLECYIGERPEEAENNEEEIKPKRLRQPRKQVLETDQHNNTFKVIEQDQFQLPKNENQGSKEEIPFPATCCYCSKPANRLCMIPVPNGADIRARWIAKLGDEFQQRLQPDLNFVCREHFSQESFHRKGRLSRGAVPISENEKVEVTYRIQGDEFLKLNEEKWGENKTATIDLENCSGESSKNADADENVGSSGRRAPKRALSPIEKQLL